MERHLNQVIVKEEFHAPPQQGHVFRPWEVQETAQTEQQPDLCQARETVKLEQHPINLFQVDQLHMQLLQEFQLAPRTSMYTTLGVDTLLHSYIYQVNSISCPTQRRLVVERTKQALHSFLSSDHAAPSSISTDQGYVSHSSDEDGHSSPTNSLLCSPIAQHQNLLPISPGSSPHSQQPHRSTPLTSPQGQHPQKINPRPSYTEAVAAQEPAKQEQLLRPIPQKVHIPQPYTSQGSHQALEPLPFPSQAMPETAILQRYQHYNHPSTVPTQSSLPNNSARLEQAMAAQFAFHCANSTKYFAPAARYVLEEWYQAHVTTPYADDSEAEELAARTGMSRAQVLKWLSNRRNRDGNTKNKVGRRPKAAYRKPYERS